jgi:hypothetical protein
VVVVLMESKNRRAFETKLDTMESEVDGEPFGIVYL